MLWCRNKATGPGRVVIAAAAALTTRQGRWRRKEKWAAKNSTVAMAQTTIDVKLVPALRDNYVFIFKLRDDVICVVDPAEEKPVLDAMKSLGWLDGKKASSVAILNTHHHFDHTGGNVGLKRQLLSMPEAVKSVTIYGNNNDKERIPGIDVCIDEGDHFFLDDDESPDLKIEMEGVYGHTIGHCMYTLLQHNVCFVGDVVFAMGCGRMFEGKADQMYNSVMKIAALPPATKIFCAHEYTLSNAKFAMSVDGRNEKLKERVKLVNDMRNKGKPAEWMWTLINDSI